MPSETASGLAQSKTLSRLTDATGGKLKPRVQVGPEAETNRKVVECGSRLPLWQPRPPRETASELAQSKTLSRFGPDP